VSRVLIVTGASRGIGARTALLGARRGYRVCVNDQSNRAKAGEVVVTIGQAGVDLPARNPACR
jgi:NAD(P)-dependent dehydrogenase (short-subunit alcohol dehydrogenase family)